MHRLLPALFLLSACGDGPETNIRSLTAEIAVAPELMNFGDVVVLEPIVEQLFISNAGKRDLEVALTLEDDKGVFSIVETEQIIPADESWSVAVQFNPGTFLDYEALLTIESNDENNATYTVPILGTGVDAPRPDIDVQPQVLDWGADDDPLFSPVLFLEVHNTGTADLHLQAAAQEGSGAFTLTTDPSYSTVAPGASTPVIITYNPAVGSEGDSGTLFFNSDDVDEPTVQVTLLGNGGGDFNYPVPVIDCPGTSAPPEFLTLDGSSSFDPDGNEPLGYLWFLTLKPPGSQGYLTNMITDTTDLWSDIGGDYEVQLQVVNSIGVTSAPERCLIQAIPQDDLHIELIWDTTNVDLDLHLLQEGFELFETPGDCSFCNKVPNWGIGGSVDDPRLDLDDRSDGPENTNIEEPEDGIYFVKVHYYDPIGGPATTATVTIFSYGVEVYRTQKILNRNEVWDVGQVNWPAGTFANDPGNPSEADVRLCY